MANGEEKPSGLTPGAIEAGLKKAILEVLPPGTGEKGGEEKKLPWDVVPEDVHDKIFVEIPGPGGEPQRVTVKKAIEMAQQAAGTTARESVLRTREREMADAMLLQEKVEKDPKLQAILQGGSGLQADPELKLEGDEGELGDRRITKLEQQMGNLLGQLDNQQMEEKVRLFRQERLEEATKEMESYQVFRDDTNKGLGMLALDPLLDRHAESPVADIVAHVASKISEFAKSKEKGRLKSATEKAGLGLSPAPGERKESLPVPGKLTAEDFKSGKSALVIEEVLRRSLPTE